MAIKRHVRIVKPFPPCGGYLTLDIYWVDPGGTTVEAIFSITKVNRSTVSYIVTSNQPPVCQLGHHAPDLESIFIIQAGCGNDTYVSPRHYFVCREHTIIANVNTGSAQAQATAVLDY